jgi:phage repressor protein C with HTH and peptisase S24 domain
VIVQPGAAMRRGDRVVVCTRAGEAMAKTLDQRTATSAALVSINPTCPPHTPPAADVDWIARIVWASQ